MKKTFLLFFIPFFLFIQPVFAEEMDIQEEIFYDILVDRFNIGDQNLSDQVRSNDPFAYHGGDFKGIIAKLNHIKKLGFTGIIISPVQKNSLDGYHGYWIEDFYEINEQFGSIEDLKQLVQEAHKRDIKVVLELVTNYVSLSHPFVNDPDKEKWFKQKDVTQTETTPWIENVAQLNLDETEVEEYLIEVAKYWLNEINFDGYRIHHADLSSRNFLEKLTEDLKSLKSDFYILANVSEDDNDVESLKEIHSIDAIENRVLFEKMNEVFSNVDQPVSSLYDHIGHKDILFVDNQNTARFSNNFAEKGRNSLITWTLAYVYLYTTPGVPVIFQGSEIPMYGPSFEESQYLVRFNSANPDFEELHERISSLRRQFKALTQGDFEYIGSDGTMSLIKRSYDHETIYIGINNGSELGKMTLNDVGEGKELRGFLADDLIRENKQGEYILSVPRESAEVWIVQEKLGINWLFIIPIAAVFLLFIASMIYLSLKQKKAVES